MVLILDRLQTFGATLRGSATTLATDQAGQDFTPTPDRYALAERYYANEVYTRADALSGTLKGWAGLPRDLRPVFSLVKPAVDWWGDSLFGGEMTPDGLPTSDGVPNRIPFDGDTPDELRLAVQQSFLWGNWASEILVYAFQGVLLGETFVEVAVDYARRKVYPKLWHPRFVRDLAFNDSGDVTMYELAIPRQEGTTTFLWGKRVTRDTVTTLKDGKPFDYDGEPATRPNPWGFVPGVWVMHRNLGGQHGAGIIDALWPVLDEFQGISAAIDDFIMKFVKQHVLIETENPADAKRKTDAEAPKRGPTDRFTNRDADRESQGVRFVPPGTKVHRIIENIGLGEATPHIDRLLLNIEKNLPELSIEQKLADLGQLTGPGARAIVAPMQRRLNDSFGNYAHGVHDIGQMCVSIMGELVNTIWSADRTSQMDKFRPFRLASYERGELDFSLRTPQLVRASLIERAQEAAAIESLKTVWAKRHAGLGNAALYGVDATGTPNEPTEPETGLIGEQQAAREQAAMDFNAGRLFA